MTTTTPSPPTTGQHCPTCGSTLADDQRYCLSCGEPRPGARRPLPSALRRPAARETTVTTTPAVTRPQLPSLTTGLAALACLLLAIGVGVLIGRGGRQQAASAPITIAGAPASASTPGATAATPAAFHSDWPANKNGWTVALQTLPKASTDAAAVAAAKTQAAGKGATKAGALDTAAYPSLTSGSYLVYAGVYSSRDLAGGALKVLKATFPDARVVEVSSAAPKAAGAGAGSAAKPSKKAISGASGSSGSKGSDANTSKAFEQTKKAPKTVGTGGKPPPKDNEPAAAGSGFQSIG